KWWGYDRLTGLDGIARNDVVVFNYPDNEKEFFIKRCVGMPGDLLSIRGGKVYIGSEEAEETAFVKHNYRVYSHRFEDLFDTMDSLGLVSLNDYKRSKELYRKRPLWYIL
ncbi:signal peptidase I, partial [Puteibacter caeruleilacunae]